MTIVADGTDAAAERISRCLFADPALGVVRHADAGYASARAASARAGLSTPMLGN